MIKKLLFPIAFLFFLSGFIFAEAKSVVWNQTVNEGFAYYWNRAVTDGGWAHGLSNPNFSIRYNAVVRNADSGVLIAEGASIPVGTRLKFEHVPFANTDISWFGTGYTSDSPFGKWISGANAPSLSCNSSDFVSTIHYPAFSHVIYGSAPAYDLSIYIPFSVNPPTVNVTHSGTASLSCDVSKINCTVSSVGTIDTRFSFSNTYGKLYYRYYDTRSAGLNGYLLVSGCYGTNKAMRKITSYTPPPYIDFFGPPWNWDLVQYEPFDYVQNVPAQNITYNLIAVSSNNPPSKPTLTGPIAGHANESYDFTAIATDPDGDTLRYGFDWDNNGIIDQWIPSSTYVSSGTPQIGVYSWLTAGSKTFKVLAQDSKGAISPWSVVHSLELTSCTQSYSCTHVNSLTCDASTCEQAFTKNPYCFDSCGNPDPNCLGYNSIYSPACTIQTGFSCDACPEKLEVSKYKEVSP